MAQNRMFNRGSKTPAVTGHRANINVGAIAGMIGGGATLDAPTDGIGSSVAEFADSAKGKALDPKGGSGIGGTNIPHYSAPWYDIQGRQQANQLNAGFALEGLEAQHSMERGLAIQELVNKGSLDVHSLDAKSAMDLQRVVGAQQLEQVGAKGGQDIGLEKERGVNAIKLSRQGADNTIGAARGLSSEGMDVYSPKLDMETAGNLSSGLGNEAKLLALKGNTFMDPKFQDVYRKGITSQAGMPTAEAMSKALVLNPGQSAFGTDFSAFGATPGATTSTIGFDPKTGKQISTVTPSTMPARMNRQIPIVSGGGNMMFPKNDSFMMGNGGYADNPLGSYGGRSALQNDTVAPDPKPVGPAYMQPGAVSGGLTNLLKLLYKKALESGNQGGSNQYQSPF